MAMNTFLYITFDRKFPSIAYYLCVAFYPNNTLYLATVNAARITAIREIK